MEGVHNFPNNDSSKIAFWHISFHRDKHVYQLRKKFIEPFVKRTHKRYRRTDRRTDSILRSTKRAYKYLQNYKPIINHEPEWKIYLENLDNALKKF